MTMQFSAYRNEPYNIGCYTFKKILRIEEYGSKIISREYTGWRHFNSDYISSAWLNPDGTRVPYCIPLDVDAKGTDKKWLDREGRIKWEKAFAFLQKNYSGIFDYVLFIVRSTGGKGIHLGIAISPIVKDGKEGSVKTTFLARQVQEALIRLLKHHGLGADSSALGIVREVPNFKRSEVSKYSQAQQLYFNKDVHPKIKREKLNVITEILAITNRLKACRPKAKKDQEGILHPHKTTEARLAHLYVDLFDNLGQTKCYTMSELIKLTQISRASLRNILVSRPKSRPKWLNVNYLNKSEGYELWINPEFGDIDRAVKLIENPEYASTFLKDLKLPEEVEDGERNVWLSSAAINYKWHGYSKHQTLIALNAHAKQIQGYQNSRNCKALNRIVGSVYRNQPQMFGIRLGQELPLVLRGKKNVKNILEGPYSTGPKSFGNTHYSLAFTRRGNGKYLLLFGDKSETPASILASVRVDGTGYKMQLRAIQSILGSLEKKPSKLIVKGRSLLKDNPVANKFAKYYGFGFEFCERSCDDKRIIREFRVSPDSNNDMKPLQNSNTNLASLVENNLKKSNWSSLDLFIRKVRLDGYIEHNRCFYWLGDSWIGRKLQVVDDGTKIEFFEKAQFIRGHKCLSGKGAKTGGGTSLQWHKAKSLDSTYRRKAQKVGPAFDQLILAQIESGQGIINTNSIFGFLRLMDSWPWEQLEAVAKYCARRRNYSYRFFTSCLEAGVE